MPRKLWIMIGINAGLIILMFYLGVKGVPVTAELQVFLLGIFAFTYISTFVIMQRD